MSDRVQYFFDTEFMENGRTVVPLSIGIVCEDGRELYLEWLRTPAELSRANEFVFANVFPHLRATKGDLSFLRTPAEIRKELTSFVGDTEPEFWAWYGSYDWMVMCQLFGNMTDLPRSWHQFFMDLRSIMEWEGPDRFVSPEQSGTAHDALDDARHLKARYDAVKSVKEQA
jgi:hypothetical protein